MFYLNSRFCQWAGAIINKLRRSKQWSLKPLTHKGAKRSNATCPARLKRRKSEAGSMMIELIAGISVMSTVAAVALTEHEDAESLALRAHAQMTSAAMASAVRLHQAKWLVSSGLNIPNSLFYTSDGIPMGADDKAQATLGDCELLWQRLMSVPKVVPNATQSIHQLSSNNGNWSIRAQGQQCQFSYQHAKLPAVSIWYDTQTGDITYAI